MESKPILKTTWEWDEWQASRAARRAVAMSIGPPTVRRAESASDRHLRKAFDGERGPSFQGGSSEASATVSPSETV